MAETKTAAPRRTRPAATAARTAPVKRASGTKKAQATPAADETAEETPVAKGDAADFDYIGDSANYSKWKAPADSGFTGTVYAKLGAKKVTVYAQ